MIELARDGLWWYKMDRDIGKTKFYICPACVHSQTGIQVLSVLSVKPPRASYSNIIINTSKREVRGNVSLSDSVTDSLREGRLFQKWMNFWKISERQTGCAGTKFAMKFFRSEMTPPFSKLFPEIHDQNCLF